MRAQRYPGHWLWGALWLLLCLPGSVDAVPAGHAVLPGHRVVDTIEAIAKTGRQAPAAQRLLTLTLVLRRADPAGFERFLRDLYDPRSAQFRQFLDPAAQAARFGPAAATYDRLEAWLQQQGFVIAERSGNRLTLTATASLAQVEQAFAVRIVDAGGGRYINLDEPSVPIELAAAIQAVTGLSDLQRPRPHIIKAIAESFDNIICGLTSSADVYDVSTFRTRPRTEEEKKKALADCLSERKAARAGGAGGGSGSGRAVATATLLRGAGPPADWRDADGSGQVVAITAFDSFLRSDVAAYLDLMGLPAARLDQVSSVPIGGGTPPGPEQSEVLLDLAVVLAVAEGATIRVYEAPFTGGGSFQRLFNRMLLDGVDVISNSWAYCENQTFPADLLSIDSVLQSAAAAGISVFSASGDSGSSCLNGAANTIAVPSGAPHLTAVGGTTLTLSAGGLWGSERWWGAVPGVQPTGQGGFGQSRFFARPAFQDGLHGGPLRSIPDVAANADPASGVWICQASAGGCPTGALFGGTSAAAPLWAAYAAILNHAGGSNLGWLNPQLYARAGSASFHAAAELQSDFAHVGLGTPNLNELHRALRGVTPGPVSAAHSRVDAIAPLASYFGFRPAVADGISSRTILVQLRDAGGHQVAGRTVRLDAVPAGSVVISPATAVTNVANGAAEFSVRNLVAQTVTFTATDVGAGLVLPGSVQVVFAVPPAAAGSLVSDVSTVQANGTAAATLTVTLQDSLGRPTPNKLIRIDQGTARATVSGPNPAFTDAAGQIRFMARSRINEVVDFRAIDVTDGDLPVPGTATVTFSNSTNTSCLPPRPVAQPGLSVTPYITGVLAENFNFGNVNWGGCPGVSNPVFDSGGNPLAVGFRNGEVLRFGPQGGVATSPLATLGPTLGWPASGLDGRLYASRGSTGASFNTGVVVEVDRTTGAVLRTLASGLTCPNGLATDPLSGDLFFDNACFGAGSDNPSLFRITDPAGTDPDRPTAVVVYATLPRTPNGALSFAPDGSLYAVTGYTDSVPQVVRISPTSGPQPPTVTPVPGLSSNFWVRVGRIHADGSARSLLVSPLAKLSEADLSTTPPTLVELVSDVGTGSIGPDGCIYTGVSDTVYRIAPLGGPCTFASSNPAAQLTLAPVQTSPNPQQGSSQVVTATLRNLVAPVGTRVLFQVSGANAQVRSIALDGGGQASFAWQGVRSGSDSIVANVTVGSTALLSNPAVLNWDAGPHATVLNLNLAPETATIAAPVPLTATLVDLGGAAPAAVVGQVVNFSVAGRNCSASTDGNGRAACTVTIDTAGSYLLAVSFAGAPGLLPASASGTLDVLLDRLLADGFESF